MRKMKKNLIAALSLACVSAFGVGAMVASADAVTLKTVDEVSVAMEVGASVRVAETYEDLGIRYSFTMSEADYSSLMANVGEDGAYSEISYGVFVAPKMYYDVHKIDNEAELLQYYCWNGDEAGKAEILNLKSDEMLVHEDKADVRIFYGAVVNMLPQNLLTEYIGIGYIKYTTNATETEASETHYRFIEQNDNVRSMVYVAQKAIEDNKDADGLLASSYLTDAVKSQATSYNVEYWLQQADGTYALDETNSKTVSNGVKVAQTVTMDVIDIAGYEYDAGNENEILSGNVYANGKLTLKAYYNQRKVSLSTAAYYQYDANGEVVLPEASCIIDGATLTYTVTSPAGETVTLGDDMVYATYGVAGTYAYMVQAVVNDEVVASETKNILIHSENVLVANGLGASAFTGTNLNGLGLGLTSTWTDEDSAPGEIGAAKVNNVNHFMAEYGNFNMAIGSYALSDKNSMTFFFKYKSSAKGYFSVYAANVGQYINYMYNGALIQGWSNPVVVEASNEWQQVTIYLTNEAGTHVSGDDIRLNFQTSGYAWDNDKACELLISNFYYDLPVIEKPETPDEPAIPENVIVANGCGEENFNGENLRTWYCNVEYTENDSAPNETGCAKLSAVQLTETEYSIAFNIESYNLSGLTKVVFPVKYSLGVNAYFVVYSPATGQYVNFDCGDKQARAYAEGCQIIDSSDEWQWITLYLTRTDGIVAGGGEIRVTLVLYGQAIDADDYILVGNFYTEMPELSEEPNEPEVPTVPENVIVANGCGEENFNGENLRTWYCYVEYTEEDSAPGETGCAKLSAVPLSDTEYYLAFNLESYDLTNVTRIKFNLKYQLGANAYFVVYSPATGQYVNMTCGDKTASAWVEGCDIIESSSEWQEVTISLNRGDGAIAGGGEIRVILTLYGQAIAAEDSILIGNISFE